MCISMVALKVSLMLRSRDCEASPLSLNYINHAYQLKLLMFIIRNSST